MDEDGFVIASDGFGDLIHSAWGSRRIFGSLSWTPKVFGIMAFWAVFGGVGLSFYLFWGFR